MNVIRRLARLVVALSPLLILSVPAPSFAGTEQEAVAMQVAMQRYIDRNSVDGALLDVDPTTGELLEVFPLNAHPMIMEGPGHYVLCADVQDRDGNNYPVDFYMVETDRGWQVFRTVINDRGALRALHQAGIYARM